MDENRWRLWIENKNWEEIDIRKIGGDVAGALSLEVLWRGLGDSSNDEWLWRTRAWTTDDSKSIVPDTHEDSDRLMNLFSKRF